jgi:hypothetical protein
MSSVFHKQVPMQIVYDLLDLFCNKHDSLYIVDHNMYKKMVYLGNHIPFLLDLKEYYHEKHYHYLNRDFTYKSFTNILRQICRSHHYTFQTKMQYNHSNYSILYIIPKQNTSVVEKNFSELLYEQNM